MANLPTVTTTQQPTTTTASAAIEKKKPTRTRLDDLKAMFTQWRPTLELILPKHISPDRVIKIALNVYINNPALHACTLKSMVRATMQCAELGLDPSPLLGEAHFIPYENKVQVRDGNTWKTEKQLEVQLQPGYVGLIKLAKQTGEIVDIYAVVVDDCEKEPKFDSNGRMVSGFYVEQGTVRKIHHIQKFDGRTGKVHAAYGVVQFKDGTSHFEVFSLAELEHIRGKSKSFSASPDASPWQNDFAAMCRKTMLKQAVKTIPKSPERPALAQALAVDNNAELGEVAFSTELVSEEIDAEPEVPTTDSPQLTQTRTQDLLGKLGGSVAHDADGVVVESTRKTS